MHPRQTDDPTDTERERERRQHDEICTSVSNGHLHHAADLAHEHLAEYPNDQLVRTIVLAALENSADDHLRKRSGEFQV